MLKAKLVVVGGDAKQAEIQLNLPMVIGRGREANLTVPHALVSRRHTEIFEQNGRLFVRDLGSLNGTFINNERIETDRPLDPNQLLTLGNITFRAVYEPGSTVESTSQTETAAVRFGQIETIAETNRQDPFAGETVPLDSLAKSRTNGEMPHDPDQKSTVYDNGKNGISDAAPPTSSPFAAVNAVYSATQHNGIAAAPSTESVKIDLDHGHDNHPDDSDLGSFLKNLPR